MKQNEEEGPSLSEGRSSQGVTTASHAGTLCHSVLNNRFLTKIVTPSEILIS